MPISIFSHGRYRLKTHTDIFVNTNTDSDMVIADIDINKANTDISANSCIGISPENLLYMFERRKTDKK